MEEKILEMLEIQESLIRGVLDRDSSRILKTRMFLFSVLGEVCGLFKADWCYCEKSERRVYRKKLKGLVSDMLKFSLILHILSDESGFSLTTLKIYKSEFDSKDWFYLITDMGYREGSYLYKALILIEKLGFTLEEIYDFYTTNI